MANFIGRLGVLLGLDSAEFQKGIQQASRQLDSFVEKARSTATVGAAAFAAMTYQAMQLADELSDTAKANDLAVDSVLKLRNALALNGGEAENAGKMLASFTANIDKAAGGSFETQKTLKTLGISLNDLRKMDMQELFTKTVDGLSKMQDPLTRNAKAMELFGKSAKGVDFANLSKDIADGAGVTAAQAQAISDAADTYDMLAQSARNTALVLAVELGPPLKATLDYFQQMKKEGSLLGDTLKVGFQTVAVVLSEVGYAIGGIYRQTLQTIDIFKSIVPGTDVNGQWSKRIDEAERERQKLDEFQRRIMGGGGAYGGGVSSFKDPRRLDNEAEAKATGREVKPGVDAAAEALRKKRQETILKGLEEEMRAREETNKLLAEQDTLYKKGQASEMERQRLAGIEIDRSKEMMELVFKGRSMRGEDLQLAQELTEIEWKRQDAIEKINSSQVLDREAREAALMRENELAEKAIELARRRNELTKQTREGTLEEGFAKGMADAMRNAATEFERGQQAFQSVMGNMESAIDKFVQTGKFAFKDFARSIIRDLIAIQMKAAALKILGKLFGGGGGEMTQSMFQMNEFADGGDPPVGQVSLVGERGPELFVPKTAGTIIPNNSLADVLGGSSQPQVVYNGPYIANMSAIDTQSGIQFLARNKQAVWSANQSAQRSMPVSR